MLVNLAMPRMAKKKRVPTQTRLGVSQLRVEECEGSSGHRENANVGKASNVGFTPVPEK